MRCPFCDQEFDEEDDMPSPCGWEGDDDEPPCQKDINIPPQPQGPRRDVPLRYPLPETYAV